MKINEIFKSIQGEGRFQGYPALFIRVSGCTRKCKWCDSKYHINGEEFTIEELVNEIDDRPETAIVVFTGGEPLLYLEEITHIISELKGIDVKWHLETNSDLIKTQKDFNDIIKTFNYIVISPKELSVVEEIIKFKNATCFKDYLERVEIKIVTDLDKINKDLVPYATSLMPYTSYNKKKDIEIRKRVWAYCVTHNLHYSARLQVINFNKKRGV